MGDDLWDARKYNRVSSVLLEWGKNVLQRRTWQGDEVVLDAGCGSGGPTRILTSKVPNGRIYAVDKDPNMVEQARANLADCKNVQVIQGDLKDVRLPEEVDVVFSNAVLHWIPDHESVFTNFFSLLKNGGELLIQCGGHGNLSGTIAILDKIISDNNLYMVHFEGWKKPWNFAGPQDTERLLHKAGFTKASAHLSEEPVSFANRESFSEYVGTVVIWPFLSRLPSSLQGKFLEAYLDDCERSPDKWKLNYVRLNIAAEK